jgi:HD-GYP domain-containing protein (c-di-GMP phosphodiesterase class II)
MPLVVADAITSTATVARRISTRLGMPEAVVEATHHLFEQWDGNGAPSGLEGAEIPVVSRIVLPTFFVIPVNRVHGRQRALDAVRRCSGSVFDPEVVDALEALAGSEEFWSGLEGERIQERVLAMEPDSDLSEVGDERIDDIAFAFADFIDLKSRFAAAHSRRVAKIAEQLARLLGCAGEAVTAIRRAALMHDLGLVEVPSYSLEKADDDLSEAERERYRLHPYHGERILKRVPALAPFAEMVGNHQERVDGSGYFRGLRGNNISLGARIIAVADRLDELTHDAPGHEAVEVKQALAELEADKGLDREVVAVLRAAMGEAARRPQTQRPAGLSQREVEVLLLAARGLTRAQIGAALKITENTVRHHLEHIYDKTGTTTRVGATMFALENGLLG